MLTFVKSVVSILMSVLCFFFSPVFGDFAADFSPQKDDCKLNFAVISDIHMTDETARRDILALGLLDMQQADTPLDALVMSGDMTERASRVQYDMLESAFSMYTPAKNIIMAVGNHDTWCSDVEDEFEFEESKKLFIEYNKKIADRELDNVYYSTSVNGYTFIMMSSEYNHTDAYISDAQLEWLDAELAKASADGKPIFVVSHWPLAGTHGLPRTWLDNPLAGDVNELEPDEGGFGEQNDEVNSILQKYENVILISGHLHNGIANDSMYGYSSVEKVGKVTSVNLPSYMYLGMKGAVSNGLGFQFEVYENEVIIRARSFSAGIWYTQNEFSVPFEAKPVIALADVKINDWESQGDSINGEAQNNIVNSRNAAALTQQGEYTVVEQTETTDNTAKFVSGDQIGVYAWTGAADEVPAERVVDGAVNTFNGTWWSANPQMPWKDMVSEHYFLGVYPAHEITDFKADPYTLDTDNQEKSDLLIAVNNGGLKTQNNPVQLNFDHAMAKIKVNLHFRNEFGGTPEVESVKLEGYTKAEVDYMAKTVSGTHTGDVSLPKSEFVPENFELSYESIVIPSTDTKTIKVSIDNVDYEYNHDTYIPLKRGKITTLDINVGRDEITLADVKISDWESQGDSINGEAQSNIVNSRNAASLAQQGEYTVVEQTETTDNTAKFVSGDQIGVYAWTGAADEVSVERVVDGAINAFNGTRWSANPQMLWRDMVSEHYFLGVYPAHEITDFKADPYTLDTANQEKSDLLIAVNNGGLKAQNNPVQLNFDHAMAKIKVNLNFRNEFGGTPEVESVKLEGYTKAEVDYMAKTVSGTYTGDVSLPKSNNVPVYSELSYESIVIPSTDTKSIRICIDNVDYEYNHDTYIPLERGKVTTIDLNVGRDEITLDDVNINDWESQGDPINGEAQNDIVNQSASVSLTPAQATAANMKSASLKAAFKNGDRVKIYGWIGDKTDVPLDAPINSVNTLTVNDGGEIWKAQPKMLWQSQTAAHYFLGIYPLREVSNFRSDAYVLDETKQKESDILVAVSDDQGIVANNRGIDLSFDHLMAKIEINLNFRNEFGSQTPVPSEVKLYCGKEATIHYLVKYVSADAYVFDATKYVSPPKEDSPNPGFDASYSSVVVPQNGVNVIDIVINGTIYRYEAAEDIPLESGKVTTINLNVGKDINTTA